MTRKLTESKSKSKSGPYPSGVKFDPVSSRLGGNLQITLREQKGNSVYLKKFELLLCLIQSLGVKMVSCNNFEGC